LEFLPGRKLGIALGLVILASIFTIPFGTGSLSGTLYETVYPWISDLGAVEAAGNVKAITYAYALLIAFILLVIAGLAGLFPLGTGVLGVVGMAIITVAPYLIYPDGPVVLSTGNGFFVIWAASIASLGASFWHGKKRKEMPTPVSVNVTQTQNA